MLRTASCQPQHWSCALQELYGAKAGPIFLGPITGSANAACPPGINPAPRHVQTAVRCHKQGSGPVTESNVTTSPG